MDTKKLQRIIYAGLFGSALVLNGVASAAVVTNRVPLLGYAEHNITVFRAPGGMKAAVVAAEAALIQITQVRADGWAYGTYPMSNGRRAGGWFRMSDVQSNVNYSNANGKIVMQQTVYRTPSMSGSNGVVVAGENVLVIAEQDGFSQIIYKQKNSANWRIGWVLSAAIQKEQAAVPMNRSQNTASMQKTTPVTSNVKTSSKQTGNDSVQKVQPTAQITATQTTSASTSVKAAVQKSTQPSTVAKTNTAASTTAEKQNIYLTNNSNAGLQLGQARNQIINRYGQALRQSTIFTNEGLTKPTGLDIVAGAIFPVLENSGKAYKITYAGKSQLQEGWVNIKDMSLSLVDGVYKIWAGTMNRRADAYHDLGLTNHPIKYEYAEKGDEVTVFYEQGNAYFISYPLTNGSYKARWVAKDSVSGTNPNHVVKPVVRPERIKGDMNQDGKVDKADLEIITKIIVGKETLTDYYREVGDTNSDGEIDVMDSAYIMLSIKKGVAYGMDAALKFKPEIAKRHVDVYDDAWKLLNGRYIDRGESYTVIEERGNRLKVNYKSAKGEDRQGWVSNLIREEIPIGDVQYWDSMEGKIPADFSSSLYNTFELSNRKFKKSYTSKKDGSYHPSNCTWYAWARMKEVTGIALSFDGSADGGNWHNTVIKDNCHVDGNISSRCVAERSGHVAFVEFVSDKHVYYTEANFKKPDFVVKKIEIKDFISKGFKNFIHAN